MFPNLFEATKEYWQQLDHIESRYQQGELSIQEVDEEVKNLMQQLGQKRRESFRYFLASWSNWLSTHAEMLIALSFVVIVAYSWMISNGIS